MTDSRVKYISNHYPLIDKRISRKGCIKWLREHDLEIPSKSACVFCPYHSKAEWIEIKRNPDDWKKAIDVDNEIRLLRPPYDLYLLSSKMPLSSVKTLEEKGQLSLWDNECSGICGV